MFELHVSSIIFLCSLFSFFLNGFISIELQLFRTPTNLNVYQIYSLELNVIKNNVEISSLSRRNSRENQFQILNELKSEN